MVLSHSDWGEMESQSSLFCISLMAKHVEQFVHLFVGYLHFFRKVSVQFICPCIEWMIRLFFGVFNFLSALYIMDIN
jgi:hypothetical protein